MMRLLKLESLGYPVENTLPENVVSALRRKLEQLKSIIMV